jgi:hypothetical protein
MKKGYIEKDKRKKILLISDHIFSSSGVGTISREIIIQTAHHFNWVQLAGSVKTPDAGKKMDFSEAVNKEANIDDSSITVYPVDGYGTPQIIKQMIEIEKPDALFLFTDPRQFMHVWGIESEIRKKLPIIYLSIWDSTPQPAFNSSYYESCDLLLGISQQTHNIHKMVLDSSNIPWTDIDTGEKSKNSTNNRPQPVYLSFCPHGLNPNIYYPIQPSDPSYQQYVDYRKRMVGDEYNFVMFFNSRNQRRKQPGDTLLAYKLFLDSLPYEDALKCKFIMHTEIVSDHGTDLEAVIEYLFGEKYENQVLIYQNNISQQELNFLYNIADVQILLSSNEGWGLSTTEAILAGTPVIINSQGGSQTQLRFETEDGKWYKPSQEVPSNNRGTYKKHGEWAFPVYPTNLSLQGSPVTPYIFDDRCSFEDAAEQIKEVYKLSREERKARGLKGREWFLSDEAGFDTFHQAERVIKSIDYLLDNWIGREEFEVINTNEYKGKFINHSLQY